MGFKKFYEMINRGILKETVKRVTGQLLREFGDEPITLERREELKRNRQAQDEWEELWHDEIMEDIEKISHGGDVDSFIKCFKTIILRRLNKKQSYDATNRWNNKHAGDFTANQEFVKEELKAFTDAWDEAFGGGRLIMYIREIETPIPSIMIIDQSITTPPMSQTYDERKAKYVDLHDANEIIKPMSPKESQGLKVCQGMCDIIGIFTKEGWWNNAKW